MLKGRPAHEALMVPEVVSRHSRPHKSGLTDYGTAAPGGGGGGSAGNRRRSASSAVLMYGGRRPRGSEELTKWSRGQGAPVMGWMGLWRQQGGHSKLRPAADC